MINRNTHTFGVTLVAILQLLLSVTLSGQDIYLEAECAINGSNWNLAADATASSGSGIVPKNGVSSLGAAPTSASDRASFQVYIASGGSYPIYARIIAPDTDHDSYWVRVNGGSWYRFEAMGPSASWAWYPVHDSDAGATTVNFPFTSGVNTIDFAYREDSTFLDKLFVSTSGSTPSGTGGSSQNCPDFDLDGVINQKDYDDDNDGIRDYIESDCGFGWMGSVVWSHNYADPDSGEILADAWIDTAWDVTWGTNLNATIAGTHIEISGMDQTDLAGAYEDGDYVEYKFRTENNVTGFNISGLQLTKAPAAAGANAVSYGYSFTYLISDNDWQTFEVLTDSFSIDATLPGSHISVNPDVDYTYYYFEPNTVYTIRAYFYDKLSPGAAWFDDFRIYSSTCTYVLDEDGDGHNNYLDQDSDNDGICDTDEAGHGEATASCMVVGGVDSYGIPLTVSNGSGWTDFAEADSDSDGRFDAYDLDSDADGCYDTQEAELIDSEPDGTVGTGTQTVDENGLVIGEVYDVPQNDAWQDNTVDACDEDGDGVGRTDDLDEDNDGIPDFVECYEFHSINTGITPFTITATDLIAASNVGLAPIVDTDMAHALDGIADFYMSRDLTFDDYTGAFFIAPPNSDFGDSYWTDPDDGLTYTARSFEAGSWTIENTFTVTSKTDMHTISMSGNVYSDDEISIYLNGTLMGTPTNLWFEDPARFEFAIDTSLLNVGSNTLRFVISNSGGFTTGIWMEAKMYGCPDSDGDGIADYRDMDSDNDGCNDAEESGHTVTYAPSDSTIAGPYGSNGLSDLVEKNDSDTTSIEYTVDDQDNDGTYNFRDPLICSVDSWVLPVDLIDMNASLTIDGSVRVNWIVVSEYALKGYLVEHSEDGANWSTLSFVKAKNNGKSLETAYEVEHLDPAPGHNYYRLLKMEENGETTELGLRVLFVQGLQQSVQVAQPFGTDYLSILNPEGLEVELMVFDMQGRLLKAVNLSQQISAKVSVAELPVGMYSTILKCGERQCGMLKWVR